MKNISNQTLDEAVLRYKDALSAQKERILRMKGMRISSAPSKHLTDTEYHKLQKIFGIH